MAQLMDDPQVGASWEGFVIEQIIAATQESMHPYFYCTQQGAECDLVLERNGVVEAAIEIKLSTAPAIEKGFRIAIEDLKAKRAFVIGKVNESYPISEMITVCDLETFLGTYLSQLF